MDTEAIVRDVIVGSPYGALIGVRLEALERDRVRVRLPFRPALTTVGDVVHGGAIAALVDVAATAAVWSGVDPTQTRRGTTVGLTVNFLAAAHGCVLVATARVVQRGRTVCVCEVVVEDGAGADVARALVTYKVGQEAGEE
jgi:uncharacterized protein (TIGR00369 family)